MCIRDSVSSANKEGLLPSPSNRYLRSTYDSARYVPIGNEFDKESRVKELGDLGEGLDVYKRQRSGIRGISSIRYSRCHD